MKIFRLTEQQVGRLFKLIDDCKKKGAGCYGPIGADHDECAEFIHNAYKHGEPLKADTTSVSYLDGTKYKNICYKSKAPGCTTILVDNIVIDIYPSKLPVALKVQVVI